MKSLAALAALLLTVGTSVPALARDAYVADNAHLFSAGTIAQINAKVADFNALTHKEVFVDTEATVDGTPQAAAERIMAQQQVNGVLIFIAKSPKTIGVVPDRASAQFFPSGTTSAIRQAMVSAFNAGNFDGGINNGVDLTLSQYRSHLGSLRTRAQAPSYAAPAAPRIATGGFSMGWIWWLIVLAVIFFVIRGIFRALAGPRMYPPGGPGYGGPGYGGPGYGGPGYGPGYGGGFGGGGGFFSGLLGGLGGAWLGNELFGNRGGWGGGPVDGGGTYAGMDPGAQQDASGWQSDAGQADMGNASFGSWGDSGGGDGGGWGGGGGDGGGGDGGGGW